MKRAPRPGKIGEHKLGVYDGGAGRLRGQVGPLATASTAISRTAWFDHSGGQWPQGMGGTKWTMTKSSTCCAGAPTN